VLLVCVGGGLVLLASVTTRVILPRLLRQHAEAGGRQAWHTLVARHQRSRESISIADPRLPGCPVTLALDVKVILTPPCIFNQ
jgi:hypothetical protein